MTTQPPDPPPPLASPAYPAAPTVAQPAPADANGGRGEAAATVFESLAPTQPAGHAPPPTVFEGRGPLGPVSAQPPSSPPGPAWLRANLPPELHARFEPVRSLNVSAGQADLVVCRERASGTAVVVKLYRYSDQLDRGVLAKLYQADPAHVVRLLDHGESQGVPWEVQEYCLSGTLADLRERLGGHVPLLQMPHIVRELAEALHHIHGLGITHRDFKPQNVLVRAPGPPPDLVLTDFGVAREQFQNTQFTSIRATFAWAAPEVHEGVLKAPVDWWALGATLFELLTSRHLLADPSGQLLPDVQVRPIVMRGLYSTNALEPGRWRDLVDGLLTYNPDRRWGYAEVDAWLNGGDPPVDRSGTGAWSGAAWGGGTAAFGAPGGAQRDEAAGAGVAGGIGAAGSGLPAGFANTPAIRFVFNGRPVSSTTELVAAMRQDWAAAEALLTGRIDPLLTEWLSTTPDGFRALQEMRLEGSTGARFVRLQTALDPASSVEFRGRKLDDETLADGIVQASNWRPDLPAENAQPRFEEAAAWLVGVRDERVLRALAGSGQGDQTTAERLGAADLLLERWRGQARQVADKAPDAALADLVGVREKALIGQFFLTALGSAPPEPLGLELVRRIEQRNTAGALWLEGLAGAATRLRSDELVSSLGQLAAVSVLCEAVTLDNALAKEAEAARRQAQEATERAETEAAQLAMSAARRRHISRQLLGQLRWRLAVGLAYALLGGWALSRWGLFTAGGGKESLITLAFAAVGVALVTLVDWLIENPAGPLRAATATAGGFVVAMAWLHGFNSPYLGRPEVWSAPLVFATAWITGAIVSSGLRRLTRGLPIVDPASRPNSQVEGPDAYEGRMAVERRIAAAFHRAAVARAWVWVPVGAALATAASGLFFDSCGTSCQPAHALIFAPAAGQSFLPFDPLSLGANPWIPAVVALLAWLCHLASRSLMRFYWRPGWAVMWTALVLALVVLVIGPDSPLPWLFNWIVAIATP
ncbi:MAG: protein kinase [Bifidobacteriaceae bacterium]|jgi:hypothetical protein|nr:protein kinase [Bifidobacteriaceae bacterium]